MSYIALDIGNVICELNLVGFVDVLSEYADITDEDANKFTITTQKIHDLGLSTIREDLSLRYQNLPDWMLDDLVKEWNGIIKSNDKMILWVEDLMERGVKVALLSNMGTEHLAILKNLLGGKIFHLSEKFISCCVGARKPSVLFYKTFLDLYPDFKGCMYLDDNLDNIKAGKESGFNAIHFDISKMKPNELSTKLTELTQQLNLKQ